VGKFIFYVVNKIRLVESCDSLGNTAMCGTAQQITEHPSPRVCSHRNRHSLPRLSFYLCEAFASALCMEPRHRPMKEGTL
jgi:hypothetical protein